MSSMLELPPALAEPPPAPAPAQLPAQLRLVPDVPLDFDAAVLRITPRLQRYARRRLGDAHEAEELVQEALLRAYKHGDALHTEDDLTAWCTVVTGRLVIDRLRVRGRSISVAEVPEGTRVGRDTAEVVVARDEARIALDALDAMPTRQAAVLWAREVEGQAYDAIGQRFGMTEPAVRSILTRARKALRKEYAARGGTLPVAGLAALAPWIGGLRWADRARSAATRLAAPAAIGAVALGLVGGALYSPLFAPAPQGPRAGAVVAAPLHAAAVTESVRVGMTRPVSSSTSRVVARATASRGHTVLQDSPLAGRCLSGGGAVVGDERCTPRGRTEGALYIGPELPPNPTGVRNVGVKSDKIDCSRTPATPVTTCTQEPSSGGTR